MAFSRGVDVFTFTTVFLPKSFRFCEFSGEEAPIHEAFEHLWGYYHRVTAASLMSLVDVTGFEPATPCLQSARLVSTHSFYHFDY